MPRWVLQRASQTLQGMIIRGREWWACWCNACMHAKCMHRVLPCQTVQFIPPRNTAATMQNQPADHNAGARICTPRQNEVTWLDDVQVALAQLCTNLHLPQDVVAHQRRYWTLHELHSQELTWVCADGRVQGCRGVVERHPDERRGMREQDAGESMLYAYMWEGGEAVCFNAPVARSRHSHVSPAEPLPNRCLTSYSSARPPAAGMMARHVAHVVAWWRESRRMMCVLGWSRGSVQPAASSTTPPGISQ